MRWEGLVALMGKLRIAHKISTRKHERKRPVRRPRQRWENNVEIGFMEMRLECVD
jgi:hypothetical protein